MDARLGPPLSAFEKLTAHDAADASAWFNLGLLRSWFGQHPPAIAALLQSIELESDPDRNAEIRGIVANFMESAADLAKRGVETGPVGNSVGPNLHARRADATGGDHEIDPSARELVVLVVIVVRPAAVTRLRKAVAGRQRA